MHWKLETWQFFLMALSGLASWLVLLLVLDGLAHWLGWA